MKRTKQHAELQERIGRKIRGARVEAGLTQAALAKHLGMTGPGLGYIEAGKRRIYLCVLEVIAQATSKPLDYFFEQKKYTVESKLLELEREIRDLRKLLVRHARGGGK